MNIISAYYLNHIADGSSLHLPEIKEKENFVRNLNIMQQHEQILHNKPYKKVIK